MKKLFVICILFLRMKQLSAQSYMNLTTYQDTANYLIHEIEMKKNLFKNKPFSVLLDSLKLQPVDVIGSSDKIEHFGKSLIFYFNYKQEFSQQHFIIVDFQSVPTTNLYSLFFPPGGDLDQLDRLLMRTISLS